MSIILRTLSKALIPRCHAELSVLGYQGVNRLIMTTAAQKAKEAVDVLKGNPYFEKYSKKIAELQQTSPEELLSRIDQFEKLKEKKQNAVKEDPRPFSTATAAKSSHAPKFTKSKALSDIMKIELLVDKTAEEIQKMWEEYHRSKDVIAATIPADTYDKLYKRSLQHPTFLLALPRSEGYEFIVCQFSENEIHFTPLISYQTHKENAPECLTITHYVDIKEEKKIVLMKGEFNKDILNVTEAQCLANQIQLYYGQDKERRLQILDRFTNRPQEFKHMDLIAELESLTL